MGLDQYAFAVLPHKNNTPTSIWWETEQGRVEQEEMKAKGISAMTEIAYWRKHPNLQGWMEYLWRSKMEEQGATKDGWDDFNCVPVQVTYEDLLSLREDVLDDNLPDTDGFFFGQSYPEDKDDDLAFIEKALEAIGQDMQIYYSSWW
jgi:hypothetical protein